MTDSFLPVPDGRPDAAQPRTPDATLTPVAAGSASDKASGPAVAAMVLVIVGLVLSWAFSAIVNTLAVRASFTTTSAVSTVGWLVGLVLAGVGTILGALAMRSPGRSRVFGAIAVGACGVSLLTSLGGWLIQQVVIRAAG